MSPNAETFSINIHIRSISQIRFISSQLLYTTAWFRGWSGSEGVLKTLVMIEDDEFIREKVLQ